MKKINISLNIKKIFWIFIVILGLIILIWFFYPKVCGNWGTSLAVVYEECQCLGFKTTPPTPGGNYYYCYGLCLENTCSYYRFPKNTPLDYCENDFDCVKEPCCYSCSSKPYVDYFRKTETDICLAIACTKEFNCSCVNNTCQASNRAY